MGLTSSSSVNQWISGKRAPALDRLSQLARELHVDLHWLLTGDQRAAPSMNDAGSPAELGEVQAAVARAWAAGGEAWRGLAAHARAVGATPREAPAAPEHSPKADGPRQRRPLRPRTESRTASGDRIIGGAEASDVGAEAEAESS
jgi:transcriptional regulator with XRE-family HTH domain